LSRQRDIACLIVIVRYERQLTHDTYAVKLVSLNTGKSQDLLCDLRLLNGLSAVVDVVFAIALGYSGLADVAA
jgi:hypothetical protein